eukprot:Rmarinus@m.16000
MDYTTFVSDLEFVSCMGSYLSQWEQSAIQTSLPLLKSQYHFTKMMMWGKIRGLKGDYLICVGWRFPFTFAPVYFFSDDGVSWGELPSVDETTKKNCLKLRRPFEGHKSFVYSIPDSTANVTEEVRLAATVGFLDESLAIVPRGYIKHDSKDDYNMNTLFSGISAEESRNLSSYLHFRKPQRLAELSELEKSELQGPTDCLDCLSDDVPQGVWLLKDLGGDSPVMTIQNLQFPGYCFYCVPGSKSHGYFYVGDGVPNEDITVAFMR